MSVLRVENELFEQLKPFFQLYNYHFLAPKKQFRKRNDHGFSNVILSITGTEEACKIEVNLGMRYESVEQIAQQFLDIPLDYRADANTLIISVGKLNDSPYFCYTVNEPDDIAEVVEQIKDYMRTYGISFLHKIETAETCNHLLNENPKLPCKFLYNQTHRCFKALISAKLNQHPEFFALIDRYREMLARLSPPAHILVNYEALANYLLFYTHN
jgi:hypothetical protein